MGSESQAAAGARRGGGRTIVAVLLLAVTILALAGPLVKWLVERGANLGIGGSNAISFCNVLFVGNLLGGIVVAILYRPSLVLYGPEHQRPPAPLPAEGTLAGV